MTAETWKLDCPWCAYHIEVASTARRGGEDAASRMVDHLAAYHPGRDWQQFLDATAGGGWGGE